MTARPAAGIARGPRPSGHVGERRPSGLLSRRRPPGLVGAALAGAGGELCAVALIATAAWLIATAGRHPPLSALALAIVGVRAFALFRGGLRYAERLAGHDATLRILAGLRLRVYEALRRALDPALGDAADRTRARLRDADLVQRMVADVEAVQDLLLRCALPAAISWTAGLGALVFTVVVLPAAGGVLAAGLVAAGAVLPLAAALVSRANARHAADARADLALHGLDVSRGAADLAAFGASGRFVKRAEAAAARLARHERRSGLVEAVAAGLGAVVQGLTTIAVVEVARARGAGGVPTAVLALTAFVSVEAMLPVADAARRLVEVLPAVRRVRDLLAEAPDAAGEPHPENRAALGRPEIELARVRVAYGDTVALDGVGLRIPPGRKLAIVGASGAGKSTLLGVLSGEIRPEGVVLVGGVPVAVHDPGDVRAAVRGVTQDAHVFATSVRANVTLGRPDAPDKAVTDALRRVGLLGWASALAEGWDTPIGDDRLSGGQRQRLLLARALVNDPPVLLLDEPAEGLDLGTADRLVTDLLGDARTVVLVTHRLAPLVAADEIVVLDRGRVAQRGPHRTLVALPGPYRDMWAAERLQEPIRPT